MYSRFIRILLVELLAIVASLGIAISLGLLFAEVVDLLYNSRHAIPDPSLRGDDLGLGMVVVIAVLASLAVSIPTAVAIHVYLFKKFMRES